MIKSLFFLLLLATHFQLLAQQKPEQVLPLKDMSAFEKQAGNWSVVGGILMDPTRDIHDPLEIEVGEAHVVEIPSKNKKKRRRKNEPVAMVGPALAILPPVVTTTPGTGILLNMNNDSIRDNLLTKLQHGDILLELDVMMPKGSNSGIYLQGRYEVQLLDSWGVTNPKYGDIGGIYRNWESEKGKVYMGAAPLTNAAKAPGLWQHFSIAFRAPRFDEKGNKVANARFIHVDLNGVRIHENLEVPLPTGGAISNAETPTGPLMIQGDHGPVAFRNIEYQLLAENEVAIHKLAYSYFPGPIADFESLQGMAPTATGDLTQLTIDTDNPKDQFGMVFTGMLVVPAAGTYPLRLNYNGSAQLDIKGKSIVGNYSVGGQQYFTVELAAGENPFTLRYFKSDAWIEPALGLFEMGSFPRPLHAYNSFPTTGRQAPPIYVAVGNELRLLRAFLDFQGDRKQRLTHTIGVGTPGGTHFIYDLKGGNPVCAWRGEFINATPMWNSRGDGSFRPRGAVQYLFAGAAVAKLSSMDAPFSASLNEAGDFSSKGYRIAADSHMPVFLSVLDTFELEDQILPDDSGNALTRMLRFKNDTKPEDCYAKLAAGKEIQQMPNGIYVVDQNYYIQIKSEQKGMIRQQGNMQELMAPMGTSDLVYMINW